MISLRLAVWYFTMQGVAVPLWWSALAVWPAFRTLFELGERGVLQAFLVPDTAFALASLVAAGLLRREHRAGPAVAGVTTGAVGYSTVMTFGHVLVHGQGVVGAVAMTLATGGSAVSLHAVLRRAR